MDEGFFDTMAVPVDSVCFVAIPLILLLVIWVVAGLVGVMGVDRGLLNMVVSSDVSVRSLRDSLLLPPVA